MFHLGACLGFPVVSNTVKFAMTGTSIRVACEMEAGDLEHIQMEMPCVVGVGKDLNKPSYPKLPDILQARKKPLSVMELSDLGLPPPASRVEMIGIEPLKEERRPETIGGDADEIAEALVRILREKAKVLD
jgi:electron transfer flavoprotein beta subunit